MWAYVQNRVGGPEVLERVEVPRPEPGAGEVLVRVAATSVNAADAKVRAGVLDKLGAPPFVLGLDVAGVVESAGAGVEGLGPGTRVFGMVFGGANAEFVVAPAALLAPVPDALPLTRAAALPVAGLTAVQLMAGVRAGDRVLVHAAAGGVGHLAVQVAARRGAYVVGTARPDNHAFLRALGANELIDHRATDFTAVVSDLDVVADLVATPEHLERSLTTLGPHGRLLAADGPDTHPDPRFHRFFVAPGAPALTALAAAVTAGELRVAERVLPIADLPEAHRLADTGRIRGKLVLAVPGVDG
ncbi:quinone oxidoreductase family protein [Nocardia thailandica]